MSLGFNKDMQRICLKLSLQLAAIGMLGIFSPALSSEATVLQIASFSDGTDLTAAGGPIDLLSVDDEPEAPAAAYPLGLPGQGAFGIVNASYEAMGEPVPDDVSFEGDQHYLEAPNEDVSGGSLYLRR